MAKRDSVPSACGGFIDFGYDQFRISHISFTIYLIDVVIFIGGLIYSAIILDVPHHWIAIGAVILLGLSVLSGVKVTRQKNILQADTGTNVRRRTDKDAV